MMVQPEINYLPEKGKIYDYFSLIINSMKVSDINQIYKDFNLSIDERVSLSYKRIYAHIQNNRNNLLCLLFTMNENGESFYTTFSNLLLETNNTEDIINKVINYNYNEFTIKILSFLDTTHNLSPKTYKKILDDKEMFFEYIDNLNLSIEFKWTFIKFIENPKPMLDELYSVLISIKNELDIEYKLLKDYRENYYVKLKNKLDKTSYDYEKLCSILPLNNKAYNGIAFEKINVNILMYFPYSIQSIYNNRTLNIYLGFYHDKLLNKKIITNTIDISSVFRAFSDEMRNTIIDVVRKNPNICLKDISKTINIPLSTLSHHIDIIIEAGIIKKTNVGKKSLFTIADDGLENAIKILRSMKGQE